MTAVAEDVSDAYAEIAQLSRQVDEERKNRIRLTYAVLSLVEFMKTRAAGVTRSDDPNYLAQLVAVLEQLTGKDAVPQS